MCSTCSPASTPTCFALPPAWCGRAACWYYWRRTSGSRTDATRVAGWTLERPRFADYFSPLRRMPSRPAAAAKPARRRQSCRAQPVTIGETPQQADCLRRIEQWLDPARGRGFSRRAGAARAVVSVAGARLQQTACWFVPFAPCAALLRWAAQADLSRPTGCCKPAGGPGGVDEAAMIPLRCCARSGACSAW